MNQPNRTTRGKHTNFFPAPHMPFDSDKFRNVLSHAERDFLMVLCHLSNRHAGKDGWFWHTDKSFNTKDGRQRGFETYGFGTSTCKRSRKKLTALGLIEIKPGTVERGLWPVTMYKINPQLMSTGDHYGLRSKTTMNSGPGPP